MSIKLARIEDYKVTQLYPVNIFQAEKNKNLAVALSFFKIGRYFSLEDIGQFKVLQKNYEKDLCSQVNYGQCFKDLDQQCQMEVKKLLNKRASIPTRESPYVKFLVKSLILSLKEDVKFASYEEEILNSWCFSVCDRKYDLTLNKNKFSTENLIYIDSKMALDKKGMIQKDVALNIANVLPIDFNQEKLVAVNNIINSQRDKLVYLYNYQEESQIIELQAAQQIKDLKKESSF